MYVWINFNFQGKACNSLFVHYFLTCWWSNKSMRLFLNLSVHVVELASQNMLVVFVVTNTHRRQVGKVNDHSWIQSLLKILVIFFENEEIMPCPRKRITNPSRGGEMLVHHIIGGHSKQLFFVFALEQGNSKLFPSPKFKPLKCLLSWRNSFRMKRLWRRPFWTRALFVRRHSVRLVVGEKEKTCNRLRSQDQQNVFFQTIIHFTIFNAIISEFGARLAQNNVASRAAMKKEW